MVVTILVNFLLYSVVVTILVNFLLYSVVVTILVNFLFYSVVVTILVNFLFYSVVVTILVNFLFYSVVVCVSGGHKVVVTLFVLFFLPPSSVSLLPSMCVHIFRPSGINAVGASAKCPVVFAAAFKNLNKGPRPPSPMDQSEEFSFIFLLFLQSSKDGHIFVLSCMGL